MRGLDIVRVDRLLVVVTLALGHLDQVVNCVACNFAEDCVFLVQVVCWTKSDEELRAIVVLAAVGHCDKASPHEPELENNS